MTHPYILNSQAWCHSLRILLGYPPYAPDCQTLAVCASSPRDIFQAMELTEVARDMQRDMIHVAFDSLAAGAEPVGVSLAVRQDSFVEWLPGCRLYAPSETAKLELLSTEGRWFVGPRNMLTSAKLPPKSGWKKGEEIALRRWREAVETMGPLQLRGSVFVRPGERYADAIPMEALKVAA